MSVDYADKKFWDARYSQGPSHVLGIFDWFPSNADKQDPLLTALQEADVSKAGRVLDIGCGNSSLCEKLVQAGYSRVVGVDYSEPAINMMRERERARRAAKEGRGEAGGGKKKGGGGKDSVGLVDDDVGVVHYHSMDATSLSFSDASFNAVLDKGLLDSIMSGLDRKMLWQKLNAGKNGKEGAKGAKEEKEEEEQGAESEGALREQDWGNGGCVLREVRRVLKRGGVYLVVSYESPDRRLPLLRSAPDWTVTWSHFEAQQDWYLYRCALPP